jgi:uncharacterized protein YwgA
MSNIYIAPVYKAIYGKDFESSFDHRMEMQKAIYLLTEMGVPVGNYGFYWYLHGPYSQTLQNDILALPIKSQPEISLSEDSREAIEKLRRVLMKKTDYSTSKWAECLASIQYIKTMILPQSASKDQIIEELEKRKPHLDNRTLNHEALNELEQLFA